MKRLLVTAIISFLAISAEANDSAVETAVGGLKLRKEHSVLMEKERLFISKELVRVEYEFRNTTKEVVVSEVAFPIPSYEYVFDDRGGRDFPDFKVSIDGKPVQFEKEVRAFVGDREVSKELRQAGITVENFGDFTPENENNPIWTLKASSHDKLVEIGALAARNEKDKTLSYWPKWRAEIKYHWRQEFQPQAVIHVEHEYHPLIGYTPVQQQEFREQITDSCINTGTFDEVKRRVTKTMVKEPLSNNYFGTAWVSYILTTANTWQTPIKSFELIVQGEKDELVTFCWDGQIEQIGDVKFRATKRDFIPTNDLKIYFMNF
jgi:hypothetical protein